MADIRTQRLQLQLDLIRLYSQVRQRPWGVLLTNLDNPTYYEANGARQIRTPDPESTISEIVRFYRTRRLVPRAIVDEASEPSDLVARFEDHGFEAGESHFRILGWEDAPPPAPTPPAGMHFTLAGRRDLDALVAIQAEDDPWSRPEWLRRRTRELLGARAVRFYLAWQSETPVAMAMYFQGKGRGLIESVATRPAYRRRGLASALVRQIQADAPTSILLEVEDEAVERLYTKLGFTVQAAATEWQCWLPAE